jgi:g-D-glutamyl-meso-diaminopimelate peptidase
MEKERKLAPNSPFDSATVSREVDRLAQEYPFLKVTSLGSSILGKGLPCLMLGEGDRHVLYVGAHHGMEWLTSAWLLRFMQELCDAKAEKRTLYKQYIPLLLERFTFHIVPMLNPDGVDYQIHGLDADNPIRTRVIAMNGGGEDFSAWQANARGVDLNHNYNAGFAEYKQLERDAGILGGCPTRYSGQDPESEPEVKGICKYVRFYREKLRLVISLHTQGEEIYYQSGHDLPTGYEFAAKKVAQLCSYRLAKAEGFAAYGGLTDWCVQKMGLPALTFECGKGKNPLPQSCFFSVYSKIREALFLAPTFY